MRIVHYADLALRKLGWIGALIPVWWLVYLVVSLSEWERPGFFKPRHLWLLRATGALLMLQFLVVLYQIYVVP